MRKSPRRRIRARARIAVAPSRTRADEKDHQHQHARPEKLGTITFPISCAPASQAPFARAVALLHSFWYAEAEKAFGAVAAADPCCAMAHWGVAMSLYHPIWAAPTPAEMARGEAAAAKAVAAGANTQREKEYVAALAPFFQDAETADHRTRAAAYEKAMEASTARIPMTARRRSSTPSRCSASRPRGQDLRQPAKGGRDPEQRAAAAARSPGGRALPDPQLRLPQLAELALPAARSYSRIAETSPHALHMPSHIFVRLGMWDDSIAVQRGVGRGRAAHVRKSDPGATAFDELHALDYLAYAFLQEGRMARPARSRDRVAGGEALDNPQFAAAYALAAVPARLALERGQWAEAAQLTVAPAWFPWDKFPYARGDHPHRACHRGRAQRRHRAREGTAPRIAWALRKAAVAAKIAYWPDQIEIQRREAAAWVAQAEGRKDEAIALMKAAVELEAATEKHPVTPGACCPPASCRATC